MVHLRIVVLNEGRRLAFARAPRACARAPRTAPVRTPDRDGTVRARRAVRGDSGRPSGYGPAPIGSRPQEGNPSRTLHLSCVLHRPSEAVPVGRVGERRAPEVAWRVTNRPSSGHRGPTTYSEVPNLERALLSYHAPVLRKPTAGGRFFDEGFHDHPAA